MPADTAPATSPVEYYYMVTILRGAKTSTREGIVTATPGVDTRQTLVNRAVMDAMRQIGLTNRDIFVPTGIYVERNDLAA